MIGWKGKYGVVPWDATETPPDEYNLSDFMELDSCPLIVGVGVPTTTYSGRSIDGIYDAMATGDSELPSATYGCPKITNQSGQINTSSLTQVFPGILSPFINSIPFIIENFKWGVQPSYLIGLLVPGLKVFICESYVYRVSGTKLIKIASTNCRNFCPILLEQNYDGTRFNKYFAYVDSTSSESMKLVSNFHYFYFRQDSQYNFKIDNVSPVQDTITAIFGEYSEPDINIPDNPYEPGGPSEEGGGGGNFDDDSDLIPDSSLPTLSSANTGFTRIYNPTLAQVQELARYLWTDETVIDTIWNHIKQYFENPMEAIIGFNLVPVPVPDGGTQNFALMYIDTGVSMTVAASQFVDVDCGTFELKPYYGSALDYAPYTKVSCFLPFIGVVQLNTDEVMNTTLQVKYRVDICSGSCVAKVLVNGNVLYQYSGHCAINIPISAADFSSYVSAAISVAKLAVGAATGGAMGALESLFGDPSQQTNQVITRTTVSTQTERNPATGRQITTGRQTVVETTERPQDTSSTQASYDGLSPANISNTVGQIMSSKPHVEHSGSFSGNTGYLGVRRPYLIIQRPNMCMPASYQQLNGFPSMITMSLGDCKGFTRVQQVQLTGSFATNPEQSEILQFLKSGVIL